MDRYTFSALGLGVALSMSGAAGAVDLVIDSEQGAARGILTAVRLGAEAPQNYAVLTYPVRDYVDRALRPLRAAWTPASLAAVPGGVDIACPQGGSFHARYAKRILDLDYNACTFEIYGWNIVITGPAQLKLKSDNFTPTTVAALSTGSTTNDFAWESNMVGWTTPPSRTVTNVQLVGNIPIGRATVDDNFEGSFSHTLSGFYHDFHRVRLGVPGEVYEAHEMRIEADAGSSATGSYSYTDNGQREDVSLTGSYRQIYRIGPWGEPPPIVALSEISGALALRSLKTWDYNSGTERFLISGSANYTWPESSNLSCADGDYNFATPVQLRHPDEMMGGSEAWNAGQLIINGVATFAFRGNPHNSELGEMHVDLEIPGIGSFDYDGNSLWETPLPALAQCN